MKDRYDALGLYHNPNDARIIVPKRVKALGWTINVGHRNGRLALGGVVLLIVILAAIQYG